MSNRDGGRALEWRQLRGREGAAMREATMNETATLSHILDVVEASHEASFDAAEAVARWRTGEPLARRR